MDSLIDFVFGETLSLMNLDVTQRGSSSASCVATWGCHHLGLCWAEMSAWLTHTAGCQPRAQRGPSAGVLGSPRAALHMAYTSHDRTAGLQEGALQAHKSRSFRSLTAQPGKLYWSPLPHVLVKANHRASPDSRGGNTTPLYGWSRTDVGGRRNCGWPSLESHCRHGCYALPQ